MQPLQPLKKVRFRIERVRIAAQHDQQVVGSSRDLQEEWLRAGLTRGVKSESP